MNGGKGKSVVILLLFGAGGTLVYSGIKNVHPLDLVRSVFTGKPAPVGQSLPPNAATPVAPIVKQGVGNVLKNIGGGNPPNNRKPGTAF